MGTIRDVWKRNLRAQIGDRTLKEVSAGADIPYRTLQNMLEGVIPQEATVARLAGYFRIPETHLFVDFEEFEPKKPISPTEALEVLRKALEKPPEAPASLSESEAKARGYTGPEEAEWVWKRIRELERQVADQAEMLRKVNWNDEDLEEDDQAEKA